ncbi:RagB/SusD family nutrient uptake outer membrane protein [Pedobacter sp. P351]|uniref:RagB/SusD family nutrient uptake outer membrane protein n=1 Tax=Pedobacter superstes TaxID=3133441 RepID=UPI0030A2EE35
MKLNFKRRTVLTFFLAVLGLASCNKEKFLLPDRMGMDQRLWENEGAVQLYINGIYNLVMPEWPFETAGFNIMYLSDESIINVTDGTLKKAFSITAELRNEDYKFIANKYQGSNKTDNKYFEIGRCNLALNRLYQSPLPFETRKKFIGQLYMLRAMAYFDIVRIWGGVPLMLKEQDPENLEVAPRSKASEVLKQIVRDLDSASVNLDGVAWNPATEFGKFTKLAAVCYKARVLLYAASPLFNPLNDPAHPFDQTKWNTALQASKEAYDLCLASGIGLMTDYSAIFRTEGAGNTEAIIIRGYSKDLEKRFQTIETKSRPGGLTGGSPNDCFVATTKLLDAYPMEDGTPISQSTTYDPVLYWKARDPRFYATIAYNGSDWKLNAIADRKQWNYNSEVEGSSKPFYCKRFADPNLASGSVGVSADKGGNGFDWIELRFAEVVLNYAECLNETDDLAGAKDMVKKIKIRATVKPGTKDYGLALATNKQEMRDLILNERQIEFAFEGKRGWDLRRTRRMHLLTGFLVSPIETTKSITKNGQPYNLKLQLEEINPANAKRRRDTLNTNLKSTYQYFFLRNPTGLGNSTNALVFPEKNYFVGLPNQFLNSSPLLEQTIGWGGTFDPL